MSTLSSPSRSSYSKLPNCTHAKDMLKGKIPTCQKCKSEKLSHYCVEKKCLKKELICIACDVENLAGDHFTHRFSYILPLLVHPVSKNLEDASESIREFRNIIKTEITKIQNYVKSMEAIQASIDSSLVSLEAQKQKRGLENFEKNVARFLKGDNIELACIFKGVDFITQAQCKIKTDQIRKEVSTEVNRLNWLTDPQKVLKDVLAERQQTQVKIQSPFSSNKIVQISQIDNQFKQYYQIYTHKLQHNPVHIKLDSEYGTKLRMFETLLYHFKKCSSLSIISANINHFKSVLQFQKLRHLELVFNQDIEAYVGLRADTVAHHEAPNVVSLSLRKFKEEDSKFLKVMRSLFPNLKELHMQFVNKYDLANNKELNDFFKGNDPKLQRLSLKFRSEAQVKKLYGNFTKFYKEAKDSAENPLQQNIIKYLQRHPELTRLCLQGQRITKVKELFDSVRQMPQLFQLKLSLMETPESPAALVRATTAKFHKRLLLNKKIMAVLQAMYNRTSLGRDLHNTTDQIIELVVGL